MSEENLLNINNNNTSTSTYAGECFVVCNVVEPNALSITKNGKQHVWCAKYLVVDSKGNQKFEYLQMTNFPTM